MPKRFDLVVFDWDGTLIDSTTAIAHCMQLACEDLDLPVPSMQRASYVIGLGLQDALNYAVPDLTEELLPRMLERYRHHYMARDGALGLFPGVIEMLRELRAAGHRLAVATGKSRVGLARGLAQCGLSEAFDATRCADETRSKPDPAMLVALTQELAADPQRTLMIGDTTHDLKMAANARTHALGVSYGAHPHEDLVALSPLACVESVGALRVWLSEHA